MGLTLQENGFNFNIINSDREYTSNIIYNLLKCQFTVDVVRVFSSHVPGSIVDDLIKRLTDNNWVRTDDNDITELKKLISTIENKLDDTGRNVVWQALKYTSYCSTLTTAQIINMYQEYIDKYGNGEDAKESLLEFLEYGEEELLLNRNDQRIVFISNKKIVKII
jgi:hypothetical protein